MKVIEKIVPILILTLTMLSVTVNPLHAKTKPDSLSVAVDSLKVKPAVEDSLFYAADSVFYNYDKEVIDLKSNTSVDYGESKIIADSISINLKKNRALAHGHTVMKDADQYLAGDGVFYDVDSKTGLVNQGAARFDKGYYYGTELRKVGDDVYDVDRGKFTTCDGETPDYYIYSSKLRFFRDNKIVGKPVIFYVNHIPVFGLPYAAFSIKRGRHPGFLIPEPGYSTYEGKYLKNIALYYPYSDYADATLSFDYMELRGWDANFNGQYIKKYMYQGNFLASIKNQQTNYMQSNYQWQLATNHHQELGNRSTLDANLNLASSKSVFNYDINSSDYLTQTINSTVSYRKPFLGSNVNISANYSDDLVNKIRTISLPTMSYTLPYKPLYELFKKNGEKASENNSWWSHFSYNYNVHAVHYGYISAEHPTFADIFYHNSTDSLGNSDAVHYAGIQHNAGANYDYKLLGWLNLTQGISYTEAWFDRDKNDNKPARGNAWNASSSAFFSMYGIRTFSNFYVSAIRHIVTPRVSFGYSPNQTRNTKFYNFESISLPSSKESRNVSLSLEQKWQLKLAPNTNRKEVKLNDFILLNSGASYNPDAAEKKLSTISHRVTLKPGDLNTSLFKLSYSQTWSARQDPYSLHWLDWRMSNWYASHSVTISGKAGYVNYFPHPKNPLFSNIQFPDTTSATAPAQTIKDVEKITNPENWSFTISQDIYGLHSPLNPRSDNIRVSSNFKLTTNWSMTYSNYLDMKRERMVSQTMQLIRQLHCWRLEINYTRSNKNWDYRLVLYAIDLPDALRLQTTDRN
ncbi:MAG TPA: putative LPS assembly protein LptD [Candidatus Cloacimonadota bacterium]|nr:putative LPS assembly protein LptD [Candidatus Cloacimonadota bacterium]